ncbi:MAG: hypothetical protein HZA25_00830 [Candidatus Niyogibacteria bacterium]|nr:hypothetical protein [Candidatus Niyogibacteria bacterium]
MKIKTKNFSAASDRKTKNSRSGVATLPTVLVLAFLVLAVGVAVMSISFSEIFVSAGSLNSTKALRYAEAGAKDALLRVSRNKNLGYPTLSSYQIPMVTGGCDSTPREGCVDVSVSGAGSTTIPKIIYATGTVKTISRTIKATALFESDSTLFGALATTTTWQEVTN